MSLNGHFQTFFQPIIIYSFLPTQHKNNHILRSNFLSFAPQIKTKTISILGSSPFQTQLFATYYTRKPSHFMLRTQA